MFGEAARGMREQGGERWQNFYFRIWEGATI